jgi:hypothetical protein
MFLLGCFDVVLFGSLELVLLNVSVLSSAEPAVLGCVKRLCVFQGSSTSSVGRQVSSPPHQDQIQEESTLVSAVRHQSVTLQTCL